jgi:hypothetical protein
MALQANLEAKHARRADLVITVSQYCAKRLADLYGVSDAVIAPELIDLNTWRNAFRANAGPPDRNKFTVLSVCRFYPRKRLDVLLHAASLLRDRIPQLEIRISRHSRSENERMAVNTVDTGWGVPTSAEVEGIQAVNAITGFENDNFTDDEILKILLDSSQYLGQRDMTVWILAETRRRVREDPSSSSWYEVQIAFYEMEIEKLELWDFNQQNVISSFLVKRQEDGKLGASVTGKYGCGFELICKRAKVLSINATQYRFARDAR